MEFVLERDERVQAFEEAYRAGMPAKVVEVTNFVDEGIADLYSGNVGGAVRQLKKAGNYFLRIQNQDHKVGIRYHREAFAAAAPLFVAATLNGDGGEALNAYSTLFSGHIAFGGTSNSLPEDIAKGIGSNDRCALLGEPWECLAAASLGYPIFPRSTYRLHSSERALRARAGVLMEPNRVMFDAPGLDDQERKAEYEQSLKIIRAGRLAQFMPSLANRVFTRYICERATVEKVRFR